ncbi:MAG TPA: ATP-binding cassette domain-containing protein [Anaerolineaceae bacterium]
MASIEVDGISKNFGVQKAVNNVTFSVEPGEIFGLLGPNGAGKTTIIRIILDIFKPDAGKVAVLGGPMTEAKKNQIGYMPEERGLYQDISLERCLNYLASLKGLPESEAHKRIDAYLERFDLYTHRRKKIKELSRGMQQKAQLIVTLVHRPDVLIIDEPFSGLDPVNTQTVKEILAEERDRGVSIIMSTHQMHQVEELCDRLVLIDYGNVLLYGALNDIRKQFTADAVLVRTANHLPEFIQGVETREKLNGVTRLKVAPGAVPQDILQSLVAQNINLEQFEIAVPTLDEIFIRVVQGGQKPA